MQTWPLSRNQRLMSAETVVDPRVVSTSQSENEDRKISDRKILQRQKWINLSVGNLPVILVAWSPNDIMRAELRQFPLVADAADVNPFCHQPPH